MKPSPDDPHHKKLESEVVEWLTANGFLVDSTTYHDDRLKSDPNRVAFTQRMSRMKDVNALIVRTTADRIAVHRQKDYSFCVECKTNSNPTHRNFTIEALPLAVHRQKAKVGGRCLYVLRDVVANLDRCFWSHVLPPIDCMMFSKRHSNPELESFLTDVFQGTPIRWFSSLGGSGDPCVLLLQRDVAAMFPDWRVAALSSLLPQEATEEVIRF